MRHLVKAIAGDVSFPRSVFTIDTNRLVKRWLPTLCAIFALIIWTTVTCSIAADNATVKAEGRLGAEYEQRLEQELQTRAEQQQAKEFLSGEASRKAAITAEAKHLAKIGQALLNSYKGADMEDAKKVMLCAVCRVLADGEFAGTQSIEQACKARDQWWGYADAYTKDVYAVAEEVASMYENNDPLPCPTDMVYASWNGTDIVLRNQWKADDHARYYYG